MADTRPHTDRFEELCSGYVLNALEPVERAEFEKLLENADKVQVGFYLQLRSTASHLAFAAEKTEPDASVKEQLLQAVNDDLDERTSGLERPAESYGSFSKQTLAIAASFALLIISMTLLFFSLNLNNQLHAQTQELEEQRRLIVDLTEQIEERNELLAILESRDVDMVLMNGMEASPNGYGKLIWDSENQEALLQVSNLPPVPNNMEYQLWIIRNNQPVSAGLFAVNDPLTDSFFKIEQMDGDDGSPTDAFAVTLEPRGGMPQPTGEMYLMGNMGDDQ